MGYLNLGILSAGQSVAGELCRCQGSHGGPGSLLQGNAGVAPRSLVGQTTLS